MTAAGIRGAIIDAWVVNLGARAEEAAQRTGELNHVGHPTELLAQAFGFWEMYPLIEQGLKVAQWPLPSSRVYWVTMLTQAVLFLVAETLPTGVAEKAVHFVQHQFGNLCRVAVVVSQVAVYYFTGSSFALLYIGLHVIDTLERNRLLPEKVKLLYHNVNALSYAIASIAMGDLYYVAAGIGSLALVPAIRATLPVIDKSVKLFWSLSSYHQQKEEVHQQLFELGIIDAEARDDLNFGALAVDDDDNEEPVAHPPAIPLLTPAQITPNPQFLINRNHLVQEPLPPIPNVDPQGLMDLWDEVEDLITAENKPQLRQALQSLVAALRQQNPRDHLHSHYLQLIASRLPEKDRGSQAEILFRLARANDLKVAIEEAFSQLYGHGNELPLRMKILHRLQVFRTRNFFREKNERGLIHRMQMWLLRHGLISAPPLGLTAGGLHAQSASGTGASKEELQDIGYLLQDLEELIELKDLAEWSLARAELARALEGNSKARLYMLADLGVLTARVPT